MGTLKSVQAILVAAGLPVLWLAGCTSYHTPGGPADLRAMGLGAERGSADRMKMPVSAVIAVVRVQAPEYRSMTRSSVGSGAVSTVLEADSEDPADLARLAKMYAVRGTIGLNRVVLPPAIGGIQDLGDAARKAGADVMFIYTMDTKFFDPKTVDYGQELKLGIANYSAHVDCMASGAFLDLKSGEIFGQVQSTGSVKFNGDDLTGASVLDNARRNAERAAFHDLVAQAEGRWQVAQERAIR